jgi:hypothetical protein
VPKESAPTLEELGVTWNESSEAQTLAALPADVQEEVISGAKTVKQAKREKREEKREQRRQENAAKAEQAPDILSVGAKFATILIDPPWDWGDEGDVNQLGRAKPDYHTMSYESLLALPVGDLACVDGPAGCVGGMSESASTAAERRCSMYSR